MSDLLDAARKALPGAEWRGNNALVARIDGGDYHLQFNHKRNQYVAFCPRRVGHYENTVEQAGKWLRAQVTARRDALDAALGETRPRWVPVGERLPESGRHVPVWNGNLLTGCVGGESGWLTSIHYLPIYNVTHWLDVQPPEVEP